MSNRPPALDLPKGRANSFLGYLLGAVLGAFAFFIACPAYILDPTNLEWVYPKPSDLYAAGDFHTHYLGWLFFRHAPWSFPIGNISSYVAPLDTFLAYTDSIPLVALPLRFLGHLLPDDFQYLGLWALLCLVLQGVFAVRVLRPWIRNQLGLTVSTILLTFSPILVFRWGHVALMSHWLILWSLAVVQENLFFKSNGDKSSVPYVTPMFILGLATLVQPYLAAMVAGVLWSMPLARFLSSSFSSKSMTLKAWLQPTFDLALTTVIYALPMILMLYSFGFLKGPSGTEGFHYFGSDVFAFLNNYGTSSFIPKFREKRGLYEGFAWPGLGVWLLILASFLPRIKKQWKDKLRDRRVQAILVVCGLMWFFALSENIHMFSFWIIDMEWFWKPFGFITSSLRTAGRFVWPIYYVVFIAAFGVVSTLYSAPIARRLFILALILQAVDLGPWIANKSKRYPISRGNQLVDPFWAEAASKYRHIKLIPPEQDAGACPHYPEQHYYEWVELADFAAKKNLSINSGYLARYDRQRSWLYCGAQQYEFLVGPLSSDSLYIVRREFVTALPTTGPDRQCKAYDGYMACSAPTR